MTNAKINKCFGSRYSVHTKIKMVMKGSQNILNSTNNSGIIENKLNKLITLYEGFKMLQLIYDEISEGFKANNLYSQISNLRNIKSLPITIYLFYLKNFKIFIRSGN